MVTENGSNIVGTGEKDAKTGDKQINTISNNLKTEDETAAKENVDTRATGGSSGHGGCRCINHSVSTHGLECLSNPHGHAMINPLFI